MEYKLIELKKTSEDGNVALILRGKTNPEYAVVRNLDTEEPFECDTQWDWTIAYYSDNIEGLQKAIECFRIKTEENYISRMRLEELATNFKDWAIDNQNSYYEDEAKEILISECELSDYEAEFFGLKESEE